ncbi:hypothetical protein [Arthrobacter agilis]|uniref:hypothetical protein n=1 Tax=Arthrobacter agilis TaxID=37921 RepID=UPI00277FD281|nr:hypothetical protein [Arthrobacter agilis]MDQ0734698.1 hypothetical protein [Arthrobacter agilis]
MGILLTGSTNGLGLAAAYSPPVAPGVQLHPALDFGGRHARAGLPGNEIGLELSGHAEDVEERAFDRIDGIVNAGTQVQREGVIGAYGLGYSTSLRGLTRRCRP